MAEEKLCSQCNKNPATRDCTNCHVPLCDECAKKVRLKSRDLADQQAGFGMGAGATLSTLRPGQYTKYLCKKCYRDLDIDTI
jgi:hypothetical protein